MRVLRVIVLVQIRFIDMCISCGIVVWIRGYLLV